MKIKRRQTFFILTAQETLIRPKTQSWWDIENDDSKINVFSQSMKELQAQKLLQSVTNFAVESYEVQSCGVNQNRTYQTTTTQTWVRRHQWKTNLKRLYEQSKDTDVEKRFVKIRKESKVKFYFCEKEVFATAPSALPEQVWQRPQCLQSRIKNEKVCLIDKPQAEHDFMHDLIERVSRYCERPIALTAEIELFLV